MTAYKSDSSNKIVEKSTYNSDSLKVEKNPFDSDVQNSNSLKKRLHIFKDTECPTSHSLDSIPTDDNDKVSSKT